MQVIYVGPHDVVEVAEGGHVATRNGDPIDVPDELGKRLLEQPANWRAAKPQKGGK